MLRFIYLINLYHTSFFSINCIKYVWHTKSLMQKWFCSPAFTVCRTLLLWELFLYRWREKNSAVSSDFFQACFHGSCLPEVICCDTSYCSGLISLDCFWKLYHQAWLHAFYLWFLCSYAVKKQSGTQKATAKSTIFSLHMFKFATI